MPPTNANPGAAGARVSDNFGSSTASPSQNPAPVQAKLTVRCREFKPLVRNTLRGFAEVHIGELRLTIKDIPAHTKGGRCWAQLPSKPQVKDGNLVKNDEGKVQYIPMLAWDTRAVSDAFSDAVVRAVRELVPEAFEEGGAE
jgi:hypothetical protein